MNDQFDELAKNMAQSVTRRGALKTFGVGMAGVALAALGLAPRSQAGPAHCDCKAGYPFGCQQYPPNSQAYSDCLSYCTAVCAQKGSKKGGGGPK